METKVIEKKTSKTRYVWNHKLVFFLLLIIVVGAGWAAIKFFTLKRSFDKEKQEITSKFVDETSKVFSWAIRSEMLRDNRDQVNQFFVDLVKEPGFRKIQFIDLKNSTVMISTDKKDEGTLVNDTVILNAIELRQMPNGDMIRSITPVMGLNSRIGILVIDRTIPIFNKSNIE
jgi:hypothetical protein